MNGGATERELGQAGSQPVCLFVKSAISASTQPVDIVSGLAMRIKDRKKKQAKCVKAAQLQECCCCGRRADRSKLMKPSAATTADFIIQWIIVISVKYRIKPTFTSIFSFLASRLIIQNSRKQVIYLALCLQYAVKMPVISTCCLGD